MAKIVSFTESPNNVNVMVTTKLKPKEYVDWRDWQGDMLYGSDDRYYYTLEDMAEVWLKRLDAYQMEQYHLHPTEVADCDRCYGRFSSAKGVAEMFWEYHTWDCGPGYGSPMRPTADYLWELFCEDFYDNCDFDPDTSNVKGLDELQASLDFFEAINRWIWRLVGEASWYNPEKHCLGLGWLQSELDQATAANRHHYLYYPSMTRYIKLDIEFWKVEVAKFF